jgi:hypothetical protein
VTDRPDPAAPPDALAALYARPGFKLRRAHQIALSVFLEECRAQEVTTTQYGILVALHERPGLDQIGLAQALGLDRSTTGLVVGLLEARALLTRVQPPEDRRRPPADADRCRPATACKPGGTGGNAPACACWRP